MYIPFYSSSKFMDFVKMRKDLKCFVISSCLLELNVFHPEVLSKVVLGYYM